MKSITFKNVAHTPESLAGMSTPALALLHNDLLKALKSKVNPVNRFADKTSALKRTTALLEELAGKSPAATPAPIPGSKPAPTVPTAPAPALSENLSKDELGKLSLDSLIAVYNDRAKKLGLDPVTSFASKESAVKRTAAVVREAQAVVNSKNAEKVERSKPVARKVITGASHIAAGTAPSERQKVLFNLHEVAGSKKSWEREALVNAFLENYTPPRSAAYDRTYVQGYVAHSLKHGFLTLVEAQ